MYTQNPKQMTAGGVSVPDNYSGNAFRVPTGEGEEREQRTDSVAKNDGKAEVLYGEKRGILPPILPPDEIEKREDKNLSDVSQIPHETGEKEKEKRLRFPLFERGIGNEELLLLSLLLLFGEEPSDDGKDSNIFLYLILLLFCG